MVHPQFVNGDPLLYLGLLGLRMMDDVRMMIFDETADIGIENQVYTVYCVVKSTGECV